MPGPILIVEDHNIVRNSLRDWLQLVLPKYRIIEAISGEEAIELLGTEKPCLIMISLNLPGMNGIEATRQIKRISPSTSVIIMTLHEDSIYEAYAQAAGASAIIPKLSTPSLLRPTLFTLLAAT